MRLIFLCAVLLLSTSYGAWAANSYTVAAGATVTIDEHGTCKKVKNTGTVSRMVPTKSAAEWTSFQNNPNGMTLSTCACTFSTWTAIGPTDYFGHMAISENGNVMVAYKSNPTLNIDDIETGQLYVSTNGGSTWTARGPNNVAYRDIDISSDGTTMFASGGPGNDLTVAGYVSTNSGTTWTRRDNAPYVMGIGVSSNGARMVAPQYGSGQDFLVSTNDGASWSAKGPSRYFYDGSISDDGTIMSAVTYLGAAGDGGNSGRIWVSTNSGSTWTARGPIMSWLYNDMSADGTVIVASGASTNDADTGIWVSTNSGTTFTKKSAYGAGYFSGGKPSLSNDGETIATTTVTFNADYTQATYNIRFSTNTGDTWTARHPINNTSRGLGGVAVSGDGQTLLTYVSGTVPSGGYMPEPGRMYKSSCN